MLMVERLVTLGGKLWELGDMKRVYFNYNELVQFFGLKSNRFGHSVDGEKVSNSRAAALHRQFEEGKFWYDLNSGQFASRGIKDEWAEKLVRRIREAYDGLVVDEMAEEGAGDEETAETTQTATGYTVDVGIRTAIGEGIPAGTDVRRNRRPGYCRRCRQLVPAGEGHLYYIDPDEAYEDSGWIVEHIGTCPTPPPLV